jgi:hypothetical protein
MIKFNDLSTPMKIAIIGGWISMLSFIYGFLVGFFLG